MHSINPESVIGPSGQPLWSVTLWIGLGDVSDVRHIRAATLEGASLLGWEARLDVRHVEAYRID